MVRPAQHLHRDDAGVGEPPRLRWSSTSRCTRTTWRVTGLTIRARDEVIAAGETDWRSVVAALLGPAPGGAPVCYQKHMAHHLLPHIDRGWIAQLRNVLLIRDPREVVASYIKSRATVTPDDIGLPQQVALYDELVAARRRAAGDRCRRLPARSRRRTCARCATALGDRLHRRACCAGRRARATATASGRRTGTPRVGVDGLRAAAAARGALAPEPRASRRPAGVRGPPGAAAADLICQTAGRDRAHLRRRGRLVHRRAGGRSGPGRPGTAAGPTGSPPGSPWPRARSGTPTSPSAARCWTRWWPTNCRSRLPLAPDLVSFQAGANDVLRPPGPTCRCCCAATRTRWPGLRAAGVRTLLFTVIERTGRGRTAELLGARFGAFNAGVRAMAARQDAVLRRPGRGAGAGRPAAFQVWTGCTSRRKAMPGSPPRCWRRSG